MVKVSKALEGEWAVVVEAGEHRLLCDADAPTGEGLGPDPHAYFDAALAACTAMTVMMVARRKGWPLEDAQVRITHDETETEYRLHRELQLVGELSAEQREYLLGIANKCPIHRLLHKRIGIESRLAEG